MDGNKYQGQKIGYFNTYVAQQYAKTHMSLPRIHLDQIRKLKKASRGKRLLDIGAGHGRDFPLLQKVGFSYLGLEISPAMIREAKRLYPTIPIMQGDLHVLPFPPQTFDAIWSAAVYHHIEPNELIKTLLEARRILTTEGVAFFSVRSCGNFVELHSTTEGVIYYYYTQKMFRQILEKAGFSLLELIGKQNPPNAIPKDISYIEAIVKVRKRF